MSRWAKLSRPSLVKGPWSEEEDNLLIGWVKEEGANKWAQAAALIPGRTGKQCRERWFNHLNPEVNRSLWSPEEDETLFSLYQSFGSSWSKITKYMPGRPENAIKNRFYSTLRSIAADERKIRKRTQNKRAKKNQSPQAEDPKNLNPPSTLYKLLKENAIYLEENSSEKDYGDDAEYYNLAGERYLILRKQSKKENDCYLRNSEESDSVPLAENYIENFQNEVKEDIIYKEFEQPNYDSESYENVQTSSCPVTDYSHENPANVYLEYNKVFSNNNIPYANSNPLHHFEYLSSNINFSNDHYKRNDQECYNFESVQEEIFRRNNHMSLLYQKLHTLENLLSETKKEMFTLEKTGSVLSYVPPYHSNSYLSATNEITSQWK